MLSFCADAAGKCSKPCSVLLAKSRRLLKFGLVAAAASAVVCGCTAAPHPVSTPPASDALQAPVVVPTDIPNTTSLRSDVQLTACAPAQGGAWRASGTVHNSLATFHDYAITVFFTDRNSTVIGYSVVSVSVPSNESKTWRAIGAVHPASPTLCLLRGVG